MRNPVCAPYRCCCGGPLQEAQPRLGGRLYTHTREIEGVGTFNVDLGFHAWFHNYFQVNKTPHYRAHFLSV